MKHILLIFFLLVVAFGKSQTPGGANSAVFRFTKEVWLNPTIILTKQNFEVSTNVKLKILPRFNANDTSGSSDLEKAFDKFLSALVYNPNVEGSIKIWFNPSSTTKPFSFSVSDELWCRFPPLEISKVEDILNNGIKQGANLGDFKTLPFDSLVTAASNYCRTLLQSGTTTCGPNPNNNFSIEKINTSPAKITFDKASNSPNANNGGVDKQQYSEFAGNYNSVQDMYDGNFYAVPWKAISTVGGNDNIRFHVKKRTQDFDMGRVKFMSADSSESYNVTPGNDSTLNVSITSSGSGTMKEVVAWYTPANNPTQHYALGLFNVYFYEPAEYKVVLVNLGGAIVPDQQQVKDTLNKIYSNTFVTWTVETASGYTLTPGINKNIHIESSGLLSNYMPDMQDIVSDFKDRCQAYQSNDDNKFYLLFGCTNDGQLQGYMPRARNTGFIFSASSLTSSQGGGDGSVYRTIAHELGHGAFHLNHIFCDDELGAGNRGLTNNIMDYSAGNALYKHQWDLIHNPGFVGWFDGDDEEGAYSTANISELSEYKNSNYYAFISPNGNVIRLPLTIKSVSFVTDAFIDIGSYSNQFVITPVGSLQGFTDKNNAKFSYLLGIGYKSDEGQTFSEYLPEPINATEKIIFGFPCLNNRVIKFKVFAGSVGTSQISNFESYNSVLPLSDASLLPDAALVDLTNTYSGLVNSLKDLDNKIITANLSSSYTGLSLDYVLKNESACNCSNANMLAPYIFGINSFITNNPKAYLACNDSNDAGYRRYAAYVLDRELTAHGIPGAWTNMINQTPAIAYLAETNKTEEYYKKSLYLWPKIYAKFGNTNDPSFLENDLDALKFVAQEPTIWCVFQNIPFSNRISLLNKLLNNHSDENEELAIGLLSEITNEDKDALIDKLQTDGNFFHQLYNYFDDSYNKEVFVNLVLSYNKNVNPLSPPSFYSTPSIGVNAQGFISTDFLNIKKSDLFATWNSNTIKIAGAGNYAKEGNPLSSSVMLILLEDLEFLGLKKNDTVITTLFYAFHLKKMFDENDIAIFKKNTVRLLSVVAAIPSGGSSVLFAVALNATDVIVDINRTEIAKLNGGSELLQEWDVFYVLADFVNVSGGLKFTKKTEDIAAAVNKPGFADKFREFVTSSKTFLNNASFQVSELQNAFKVAFADKTFIDGITYLKNGFAHEVKNNLVAYAFAGNIRYSIASMEYMEGIGQFCYKFAPGKTIYIGTQTFGSDYEKLIEVKNSFYYKADGALAKGDYQIYRNTLTGELVVVEAQRAGSFLDDIYNTQKNISNQWKNVISGASNARKGNFGEITSDVVLTEHGFEPLHIRIENIDETTHQGIDGVFRRNGEYYIVEAKYKGTATLSTLADGTKQMSDTWIRGNERLINAVGEINAQEIIDTGYRRLLAEVNPDGSVVYKELDANATVLGIFNP